MNKNSAKLQTNQFSNLQQSLFVDLPEASQANISGGYHPHNPRKVLYNFVDATTLSSTAQSKGA